VKDVGRIVIIGAGPTGLGAAHRLKQMGYENFAVLEASAQAGGLSASTTVRGFTWDIGGHVFFGGTPEYHALLDAMVPRDTWVEHERDARCWVDERFVPYPIQHHAAELGFPVEGPRQSLFRPRFQMWLENEFSPALLEKFFLPYNRKVWGWPLDILDAHPIVDRVASAGPRANWGPHQRFWYPKGGAGSVWQALADGLGAAVTYDAAVVHVDTEDHLLTVESHFGRPSTRVPYDVLISTMPVSALVHRTSGMSIAAGSAASELCSSGLVVIGFGIKGEIPDELRGACWWYDANPAVPYHRVNVLSEQAPGMAPPGHWSLMVEVCESAHRPLKSSDIVSDCAAALTRWMPKDAIVSVSMKRPTFAYPTPTVSRDACLAVITPALRAKRIVSCGRFGSWRYELGNMDACVDQGMDTVNRLLLEA
jgi:protoporphyrinogen oxidase